MIIHSGDFSNTAAYVFVAFQLLAMMRVGVLHGGLEQESEKAIPPSQKLRILKAAELAALATSLPRVSSADYSPAGSGTSRPVAASLGFKHDNNNLEAKS